MLCCVTVWRVGDVVKLPAATLYCGLCQRLWSRYYSSSCKASMPVHYTSPAFLKDPASGPTLCISADCDDRKHVQRSST